MGIILSWVTYSIYLFYRSINCLDLPKFVLSDILGGFLFSELISSFIPMPKPQCTVIFLFENFRNNVVILIKMVMFI